MSIYILNEIVVCDLRLSEGLRLRLRLGFLLSRGQTYRTKSLSLSILLGFLCARLCALVRACVRLCVFRRLCSQLLCSEQHILQILFVFNGDVVYSANHSVFPVAGLSERRKREQDGEGERGRDTETETERQRERERERERTKGGVMQLFCSS